MRSASGSVARWSRGGAALLIAALVVALSVGGCAHEEARGRPWVHAVRFHGNEHFSSAEIFDRMLLEKTSWIPLRPRRYLDPLTLEVDRRRIEAFYRAHGWFAARVTGARQKRRDDSVDIDIDIVEGQPTTIRRVEIRGLESLSEAEREKVLEKLPLSVGQVFDHQGYLDEKGLLAARLRVTGRAWAEVGGEVQVDRDARTATVQYVATPGPVAHFGEVIVEGSTDPEAVARRSTVRRGELYAPDVIDSTRDRIQGAGGFSEVRVRAVPRDGDRSIVDVVITVAPGTRNDLKIGVGFGFDSDRQSVRLPIAYTRYHFLGGLRTLRVALTPAYFALPSLWNSQASGPAVTADVAFTQPDFLLRGLGLSLRGGFDLGVDYAFRYYGPRGAVGVDYGFFRDRLLLALSYNFQYLIFYDLSNPALFNSVDFARVFIGYTNPYPLGYFLETITLDLRDNPTDPRRGFYVALSAEEGLGFTSSAFAYEKLSPDLRFYVPLGSRVVLAQRTVFGQIFPRGQEASPITRRFYAGGADSHRGFGYNRLSPQIASSTGNFTIPVGGDQLFLSQTEIRGDLFRLRGSWVGVAAFLDMGDVPERTRSLDFAQLYIAVGPGIRYRTVVGVLRFDLGIRLNRLSPFQPDGRQNADPGQRFAFHLSLGEAF